jgi:hypothetical protein
MDWNYWNSTSLEHNWNTRVSLVLPKLPLGSPVTFGNTGIPLVLLEYCWKHPQGNYFDLCPLGPMVTIVNPVGASEVPVVNYLNYHWL